MTLEMSPELAALPDQKELIEAAGILINMSRDPALATFALNAQGADVPAKVRAFIRAFDKAVDQTVDKRFERTGSRDRGVINMGEFLSMAREVQSEDTTASDKDKLISEMVRALKTGRVR